MMQLAGAPAASSAQSGTAFLCHLLTLIGTGRRAHACWIWWVDSSTRAVITEHCRLGGFTEMLILPVSQFWGQES